MGVSLLPLRLRRADHALARRQAPPAMAREDRLA